MTPQEAIDVLAGAAARAAFSSPVHQLACHDALEVLRRLIPEPTDHPDPGVLVVLPSGTRHKWDSGAYALTERLPHLLDIWGPKPPGYDGIWLATYTVAHVASWFPLGVDLPVTVEPAGAVQR